QLRCSVLPDLVPTPSPPLISSVRGNEFRDNEVRLPIFPPGLCSTCGHFAAWIACQAHQDRLTAKARFHSGALLAISRFDPEPDIARSYRTHRFRKSRTQRRFSQLQPGTNDWVYGQSRLKLREPRCPVRQASPIQARTGKRMRRRVTHYLPSREDY